MPRIARVIAENYPHHITQRGTNKTDIFLDNEGRNYFLQCIKRYAERTNTKIWAYCLMDNHFHLVLVPETEGGLSKCLHGTTFRYAQYFNQRYKRSGRLWQNRYFSCVVDKGEYLWGVIRYIERNPVRANLVSKPEDWEWSSARAHIKGIRDPIITDDWLSDQERKEYRKFIKEDGREDEIRKATSTGRPLGGLGFIKKLEKETGKLLKPKKAGRPKKSK